MKFKVSGFNFMVLILRRFGVPENNEETKLIPYFAQCKKNIET
jgi:hypothetical protein